MMNTINEILSPNAASASAANTPSDELGQEQFLELMVAQLANQDPTNPTDSNQLFSQIAEFSVVEGVNDLSKSFEEFTGLYAGSQAINAVNLVGRDVMTETNMTYLDDQSAVTATLDLPKSASSAVIYIQDEYGVVVDEISLGQTPMGQQAFEWDGTDSSGRIMDPGNYWFSADAFIDGQTTAVPVYAHSRVDSVLIDSASSDYQLQLNGGATVNSNEILRIFQ